MILLYFSYSSPGLIYKDMKISWYLYILQPNLRLKISFRWSSNFLSPTKAVHWDWPQGLSDKGSTFTGAGRSVAWAPRVSLVLYSQEDSVTLLSLSDVPGVPYQHPFFKNTIYLENLDFVLSFLCTLYLYKGWGEREGRNKPLLLKLLHDSLDQGTPKGHCPRQRISLISFSVMSCLAGKKGNGPELSCIFQSEKMLEGSKPTLMWNFLLKK